MAKIDIDKILELMRPHLEQSEGVLQNYREQYGSDSNWKTTMAVIRDMAGSARNYNLGTDNNTHYIREIICLVGSVLEQAEVIQKVLRECEKVEFYRIDLQRQPEMRYLYKSKDNKYYNDSGKEITEDINNRDVAREPNGERRYFEDVKEAFSWKLRSWSHIAHVTGTKKYFDMIPAYEAEAKDSLKYYAEQEKRRERDRALNEQRAERNPCATIGDPHAPVLTATITANTDAWYEPRVFTTGAGGYRVSAQRGTRTGRIPVRAPRVDVVHGRPVEVDFGIFEADQAVVNEPAQEAHDAMMHALDQLDGDVPA